ncbi:FIST N-terminal domain-containing protein [Pontibacter sp. G13]|uniref:FIST signal transduction protein n=1 Tax=Pontibacter sp. G13 TaxID=3074898 RepID=UPI0028891D68|nr:FIST N-terminal domain-containing protein [Pontibacter sp. G13]WNJ18096.1 FIST N-terminal domain-containing protein [Pontibacter sp. G13]
MKIVQYLREGDSEWDLYAGNPDTRPQLVLYFGGKEILQDAAAIQSMRDLFPDAEWVGGTTAGEIIGTEVLDDSIVATGIEFQDTEIQVESLIIEVSGQSYLAGAKLAQGLQREDLAHVFVLSDGHVVNGSNLVKGLKEHLDDSVVITGGLAGDGDRFEQTLVGVNGSPIPGQIAVVGFYGENLEIGHGSVGGWDAFGPERTITSAKDNVLYELDGQPALELYKKYLGEEAQNLPASALEFPLMIRPIDQDGMGTVRTILQINEEDGSMVFAGDMPEGHAAQLMTANFERLVDGAAEAAKHAREGVGADSEEADRLALMVSCVGRKIVMGQRVVDEVEVVSDVLGENILQAGFYSYGEISPHVESGYCDLHNQTMTITYLSEKQPCTNSSQGS